MTNAVVLLVCFCSVLGLVSGTSSTTVVISPSPSPAINNKTSIASTIMTHFSAKTQSTTMKIQSTMVVNSTSTMPPVSSTVQNQTTPKPTTTPKSTTPKPTTPKPTTKPPYATFDVKMKNGNYCIVSHFEASFSVQYKSKNESSNKTEVLVAELNRTTAEKVNLNESACYDNSSKLVMMWSGEKASYIFAMEFVKVFGKSESWKVSGVSLNVTLNNSTIPGGRTIDSTGNVNIGTQQGENYRCESIPPLDLKTKENGTKVTVELSKLKVEPFINKKIPEFDAKSYDCEVNPTTVAPTPGTNDIVPIAVGCALAGLVLIVLIAYIIGRRKSHRGYEKV